MEWFDDVRVRHYRRILLCGLLVTFLYINWGYSFDAANHLVLSARASFYHTVDEDLARALGGTTLAFGNAVSTAIGVGLAWGMFEIIIRWLDPDAKHRENDSKRLISDNKRLNEQIRESNAELSKSNLIVSESNVVIAELQEKVAGLGFEFEKLQQKTQKKKLDKKSSEPKKDLDLFQVPTPITSLSKARFKRRFKPPPKF